MSKRVIKDSVVFVTGANRGIGWAIVQEALRRGASKVYAAARNIDKLSEMAEQSDGKIVAIELDVTDQKQIASAAQQASDTQVLINNAGISGASGFVYNYNDEMARIELEVNYFGPLYMTRAFSEMLVEAKGVVVNVVSLGGFTCLPVSATYSASKAAAQSLTQGMRAEFWSQGVSVFGAYPGPIDTDMASGLKMFKESPENVALRIFDGMEQGIQDIATDKFSTAFLEKFKADYKAAEKQFGQMTFAPKS